MNTLAEIAKKLRSVKEAVITSHVRLDGDALGSQLGLARMLEDIGVKVRCRNSSSIPMTYKFLPGIEKIEVVTDEKQAAEPAELLIALDSPTPNRLGLMRSALPLAQSVIALDHHPMGEPFGNLNYFDPGASSVGEIIVRLADEGNFKLDRMIAFNLLCSLYTDTGRFCHANTHEGTFAAAARLLSTGVKVQELTDQLYKNYPLKMLKLQSDVTSTLQVVGQGRVAYCIVTLEMLRRHDIDPLELQDFADIPRMIEGVQAGILFQEMEPGPLTKASFRSKADVDVNRIARLFGGGGHVRASGAVLKHSLEDAVKLVLDGTLRNMFGPGSENRTC